MVATWLVELLLDQINRALLEDTPDARAAVDDLTARLRAFLKARAAAAAARGAPRPPPRAACAPLHAARCVARGLTSPAPVAERCRPGGEAGPPVAASGVRLRAGGGGADRESRAADRGFEGFGLLQERVATLDVGATVHLLASYGRLDDLMHYATFRQVRPATAVMGKQGDLLCIHKERYLSSDHAAPCRPAVRSARAVAAAYVAARARRVPGAARSDARLSFQRVAWDARQAYPPVCPAGGHWGARREEAVAQTVLAVRSPWGAGFAAAAAAAEADRRTPAVVRDAACCADITAVQLRLAPGGDLGGASEARLRVLFDGQCMASAQYVADNLRPHAAAWEYVLSLPYTFPRLPHEDAGSQQHPAQTLCTAPQTPPASAPLTRPPNLYRARG